MLARGTASGGTVGSGGTAVPNGPTNLLAWTSGARLKHVHVRLRAANAQGYLDYLGQIAGKIHDVLAK